MRTTHSSPAILKAASFLLAALIVSLAALPVLNLGAAIVA
jgi:hypothetical protein